MWHPADGCVIIHVVGNSPARFLNRLLEAGIPAWDVANDPAGGFCCRIPARAFPRLRPIRRACGCSIHIQKRVGAPFLLLRARRRAVLLVGLPLAFCLLLFASTRIWVIDVTGCVRTPEAVVRRALLEEGIAVGASRKGLDLPAIRDRVRAYDERIAFAGVALSGVICRVEIEESAPLGETVDWSVPCDVVAVKDGVVASIAPLNGKANYQPGEAVWAGDILIRGDITREDAEERLLVHARGEVIARVFYFAESVCLPETVEMTPTGRTEPYRRVTVAGIPLGEPGCGFAAYTLELSEPRRVRGLLLPIRVTEGVFHETEERTRRLPEAEMRERALAEAEMQALKKVPHEATVVEKSATVLETDGCMLATVCVVAHESIGITKEIQD